MTIDDKIRDWKLQYNIKREAAKISELSSGKSSVYIKNHKFLDKSIHFWLAFGRYCFHGQVKNDTKCSCILFLVKYKTCNITVKIEQTIVYA